MTLFILQLMSSKNICLETITDEELLKVRISDLPIEIKSTWVEECVQQLYQELEEKGLNFRPECYLADEWLTPQYETCIGIPFYLIHPTLIRLEKKFMIDAEGDGKVWCMKLLRHEAGHAISYAYRLHRQKKWQKIFGPSTAEYGENYKYRPYSKNYVRHLDGFYAQYHPEEDFVETFAVWLTPGLDWKEKYQGWKALAKLNYVDELMQGIKGVAPIVKSSEKFWRFKTLRYTLNHYYKNKRNLWAEDFPDFHDTFLKKHFVLQTKENKQYTLASQIIRKYRREIIKSVGRYCGEKKYVINLLLKDINKRCRELKLVSLGDESVVVLNLSVYCSTLIMNYLYTGQFRGQLSKRKKK